MTYHEPVLKKEVLEYLSPELGKKFIDATLGDGGHTVELLKAGPKVLGIDCYKGSLDRATNRIEIARLEGNFTGVLGNFRDLENIAQEKNFTQVNGILFDLGFSSSELEENLGLSFTQGQPLDMRLDPSLGVTAADILNTFPEAKLTEIFFEYANERLAKKFAKAITESRNLQKLQTTKQLAELLKSVAPPGYERGRIHPATRVFQALRIVVNDEIENLKTALPQVARLLLPGGRMLVISFHSLEDKVAKDFGHAVQPALEDLGDHTILEGPILKELTKKPIVPSAEEIAQNVRSRSAKLRVFERI
jgi:16S rRNA (cytosine1402-N4)-methyltransferase